MAPGSRRLNCAEVGSSLPSAAVCAAIGISLSFLVASRRHISGMAVLLAGAGVSLAVALSALLTSSAYVLDVVLSLPVAWAGVVLSGSTALDAFAAAMANAPADAPAGHPRSQEVTGALTISRITSSAIIEPSTPVSAPSTPASEHAGTVPGGGGSGNRQR